MRTHAEQAQKNEKKSVANDDSNMPGSAIKTFHFGDNRLETMQLRKLQEMVRNGSRGNRLRAGREMAIPGIGKTTGRQPVSKDGVCKYNISNRERMKGMTDAVMQRGKKAKTTSDIFSNLSSKGIPSQGIAMSETAKGIINANEGLKTVINNEILKSNLFYYDPQKPLELKKSGTDLRGTGVFEQWVQAAALLMITNMNPATFLIVKGLIEKHKWLKSLITQDVLINCKYYFHNLSPLNLQKDKKGGYRDIRNSLEVWVQKALLDVGKQTFEDPQKTDPQNKKMSMLAATKPGTKNQWTEYIKSLDITDKTVTGAAEQLDREDIDPAKYSQDLDTIRQAAKIKHSDKAVVPHWETEPIYHTGKKMEVVYMPGAYWSKGADTGGKITPELDWFYASGNYIRGHLLNAHVGGPPRNYNLAPLTSDANGVHSKGIEELLKPHVGAMQTFHYHGSPQIYRQIRYTVELGGKKSPRNTTANWEKAMQYCDDSANSNKTVGAVIADTNTDGKVAEVLGSLGQDVEAVAVNGIKPTVDRTAQVFLTEDYLIRDWLVRLQIDYTDGSKEQEYLKVRNDRVGYETQLKTVKDNKDLKVTYMPALPTTANEPGEEEYTPQLRLHLEYAFHNLNEKGKEYLNQLQGEEDIFEHQGQDLNIKAGKEEKFAALLKQMYSDARAELLRKEKLKEHREKSPEELTYERSWAAPGVPFREGVERIAAMTPQELLEPGTAELPDVTSEQEEGTLRTRITDMFEQGREFGIDQYAQDLSDIYNSLEKEEEQVALLIGLFGLAGKLHDHYNHPTDGTREAVWEAIAIHLPVENDLRNRMTETITNSKLWNQLNEKAGMRAFAEKAWEQLKPPQWESAAEAQIEVDSRKRRLQEEGDVPASEAKRKKTVIQEQLAKYENWFEAARKDYMAKQPIYGFGSMEIAMQIGGLSEKIKNAINTGGTGEVPEMLNNLCGLLKAGKNPDERKLLEQLNESLTKIPGVIYLGSE